MMSRAEREVKERLLQALQKADWKTISDVILDLYKKVWKLERFAADLIAELEASRERKK